MNVAVWLPMLMTRELRVSWFVVVTMCDLRDGDLVIFPMMPL